MWIIFKLFIQDHHIRKDTNMQPTYILTFITMYIFPLLCGGLGFAGVS